MDSFEANTHVFIVRIWLEPRDSITATPEWRGMIEHVPSGERHYLQDLQSVPAFIQPYLEQMGVKFNKH